MWKSCSAGGRDEYRSGTRRSPDGRSARPGAGDLADIPLDDVERAIADIAAGRPVVVVDDADRENEGDIIFAASKATPELLAFTIRHTSGVICVPMPGADLDRLQLPLMTAQNKERMRTAFTVSVDARDGVTTGISATDRARTIRTLVDSATEPYELVRPGHIFPLRYTEGGVLRRPGHTEAAVDLTRLAGLTPAGVLAEVVNDDGTMARLPSLREFCDARGLALISIAQLIEYRRHREQMVTPDRRDEAAERAGPVARVRGPELGGRQRAGRAGARRPRRAAPTSRCGALECLTGDVFGSQRCDCGAQLDAAMAAIAAEGRGVVLYLRGHEGRGIGLLGKLQAYHLQDGGADTVDQTWSSACPPTRASTVRAHRSLPTSGASIRLLTNNPAKVSGLSGFGIDVIGRVPLPVIATTHNLRYLVAKRDRLGHLIEGLPSSNGAPAGPGARWRAAVQPVMPCCPRYGRSTGIPPKTAVGSSPLDVGRPHGAGGAAPGGDPPGSPRRRQWAAHRWMWVARSGAGMLP